MAKIDLDELPRIGVLKTGSMVPPNKLTNSHLEELVDTSDEWIVSRTGIKERRISTKTEPLPVLGAVAGRATMNDPEIDAKNIAFLIFANNKTGPYNVPDNACISQHLIGANNALALDTGGGCSGGIIAEARAYEFLKTKLMNKLEKNPNFLKTQEYQEFIRNTEVLVLAGDTLSTVVNYEDRNTCVLLSDGVGAARIGYIDTDEAKQEKLGYLSFFGKSDGDKGNLLWWPSGLGPQFENKQGKFGFSQELSEQYEKPYFHMNGKEVFKNAIGTMAEAFLETVKEAGIDTDSEEFHELLLNPHQANLRIMQGVVKRLGIHIDNVYVDGVRSFANNSLATYMIGQDELYRNGRLWKGRLQAKTAFGGGLSWAASLMRWALDKPTKNDVLE